MECLLNDLSVFLNVLYRVMILSLLLVSSEKKQWNHKAVVMVIQSRDSLGYIEMLRWKILLILA